MKNNLKLGITIFISILIPIGLQTLFKDSVSNSNSFLMSVFWMFANFLFLNTIIELYEEYSKLFRLKNLKINTLNYIGQILIYVVFTIFLNLYIFRILYLPNDKLLTNITSPVIMAIILVLFLLNLLSGLFGNKEESKDINIYTFSNKNSFRTGRDMFNVAGGTYEDGLVLGSLAIAYDSIKSVYTDKDNSLVIKGKDHDGNYRISIDSEKTSEIFEKHIQNAITNGKLDNKLVRLR